MPYSAIETRLVEIRASKVMLFEGSAEFFLAFRRAEKMAAKSYWPEGKEYFWKKQAVVTHLAVD